MIHATIPFVLFASLDAHNSSFLKETAATCSQSEFNRAIATVTGLVLADCTGFPKAHADTCVIKCNTETHYGSSKGVATCTAGSVAITEEPFCTPKNCSSAAHNKESCKANDDCVWKLTGKGPDQWACEHGNEQQEPTRSECLHEQPTGGASAKFASMFSSFVVENPIGKRFPKNATCEEYADDYCPDVVSGWRNTRAAVFNFASKEAMEKCCFKTCLNTHIKKKLDAQANGSIGVDPYTVLRRPTAVWAGKAITDPQTCHAAAIVTGYSFHSEEDVGNELPGCYVKPHGSVFYNRNPNGKAGYSDQSRPIRFSATSEELAKIYRKTTEKTCPPSTELIRDEEACRDAAQAFGHNFIRAGKFQTGCYHNALQNVSYNAHNFGEHVTLICAVA